jgi:hypothetical protein
MQNIKVDREFDDSAIEKAGRPPKFPTRSRRLPRVIAGSEWCRIPGVGHTERETQRDQPQLRAADRD